jgi:hypothetical protein
VPSSRHVSPHLALPGPGRLTLGVDRFLGGRSPLHGFNTLGLRNPTRAEAALFKVVYNVSPNLLPHRNQRLFGPLNEATTLRPA